MKSPSRRLPVILAPLLLLLFLACPGSAGPRSRSAEQKDQQKDQQKAWLRVELDLFFGCRGDMRQALVVEVEPTWVEGRSAVFKEDLTEDGQMLESLPENACLGGLDSTPPCDHYCGGPSEEVLGLDPEDESDARLLEKIEREVSDQYKQSLKAREVFDEWIDGLREIFPGPSWVRITLRNPIGPDSRVAEDLFFYSYRFSLSGYCDVIEVSGPTDVVIERLPDQVVSAGGDVLLWRRVPAHHAVVHGVLRAMDLHHARRLLAALPVAAGQGTGGSEDPPDWEITTSAQACVCCGC